jgi:hypothetical protein
MTKHIPTPVCYTDRDSFERSLINTGGNPIDADRTVA